MSKRSNTNSTASRQALANLQQRGWLESRTADAATQRGAVRRFQRWAGLKPDGVLGPVTTHHLLQPRICGTPDAMGTRRCKWPIKRVTWHISDSLPGVSDADFTAAFAWATEQVNGACGATLVYTDNHRTAHVLVRVANLGGPGGTLADSMLPCGASSTSQMRQRYDNSELWYASLGPPPQGKIPLPTVGLHELLHAMGVPHRSPGDGPGPALMDPTLNLEVLTLQDWDIDQLQLRYEEGDAPTTRKRWVRLLVDDVRIDPQTTGIFQGG